MSEILGFVVLTGPLFLVVLWLPISIALAWWVSKKSIKKELPVKILLGVIVFLVVLLLPVSDEIAGRIYFNHLCETVAGVKVYQPIGLPAEYWGEDGEPKFFDKKTGNLLLKLSQYAEIKSDRVNHHFGIEERRSTLLNKETHQKISENLWMLYWGGWIKRNFSPHNTASQCGGKTKDLVDKLFVLENADIEGLVHGNN